MTFVEALDRLRQTLRVRSNQFKNHCPRVSIDSTTALKPIYHVLTFFVHS